MYVCVQCRRRAPSCAVCGRGAAPRNTRRQNRASPRPKPLAVPRGALRSHSWKSRAEASRKRRATPRRNCITDAPSTRISPSTAQKNCNHALYHVDRCHVHDGAHARAQGRRVREDAPGHHRSHAVLCTRAACRALHLPCARAHSIATLSGALSSIPLLPMYAEPASPRVHRRRTRSASSTTARPRTSCASARPSLPMAALP